MLPCTTDEQTPLVWCTGKRFHHSVEVCGVTKVTICLTQHRYLVAPQFDDIYKANDQVLGLGFKTPGRIFEQSVHAIEWLSVSCELDHERRPSMDAYPRSLVTQSKVVKAWFKLQQGKNIPLIVSHELTAPFGGLGFLKRNNENLVNSFYARRNRRVSCSYCTCERIRNLIHHGQAPESSEVCCPRQ